MRVVIAEDLALLRDGLARLLRDNDIEVVAAVDHPDALLAAVLSEFHGRHQRLVNFFEERFEAVRPHLLTDRPVDDSRRLLIGAYFTQEYALESAALFNPALVWHPDQEGLPPGVRRFIVSLRATGEGHISSVGFRAGTVDPQGHVSLTPPTGFVTPPRAVATSRYEKPLFLRKLAELGVFGPLVALVFDTLADGFTLARLKVTQEVWSGRCTSSSAAEAGLPGAARGLPHARHAPGVTSSAARCPFRDTTA